MYRVTVENQCIESISKQGVIDSVYKSMKTIANRSKEVCITMDLESCVLDVWIVDSDKLLLFYNPLDVNQDYKISCSCKIEDMDSNTFVLKDNGHYLDGCSKYNLISMERAIKEIESIVNNRNILCSDNWYSY